LQIKELEQAMDSALGNAGLFGGRAHTPIGADLGLAREGLDDRADKSRRRWNSRHSAESSPDAERDGPEQRPLGATDRQLDAECAMCSITRAPILIRRSRILLMIF
jgi:hypothetical protein